MSAFAVFVLLTLAQAPAFEVATIKPTPPDFTKGRYIRMQSTHELIAKNHTLKTLLQAAYNLSPKAVLGGPAWFDSEHFDILAKAPGEKRPSLDEQMAMLRQLLNERFALSIHREEKEMGVYILTQAKGGSKLKETTVVADSTPEGPPALAFVIYPESVKLPARWASVADFASVLQRAALDRPVLDRTGLKGRYDFDLDFAPDETLFGGALGKGPQDENKPGLFAALQQQLGLKIEAGRGPVDTLVVDSAQRPTAN